MNAREPGAMAAADFAKKMGTTSTVIINRYCTLRSAALRVGEKPPEYLIMIGNRYWITPDGQKVLGKEEEWKKALKGYTESVSDWLNTADAIKQTGLTKNQLILLCKALERTLGGAQAEEEYFKRPGKRRVHSPRLVAAAQEMAAIRQEKVDNPGHVVWDDIAQIWAERNGVSVRDAPLSFVERFGEESKKGPTELG